MNRKQEEYKPNKILNLLLIIGYSAFIPYMIGYFYNLYLFNELRDIIFREIGEYITRPDTSSITTQMDLNTNIMVVAAIIYFIVVILSVFFIVSDAKKLHVGAKYSKESFFKSLTWNTHSWGTLTFFFWWFTFPLYIYHRKEIYEINKEAYDAFDVYASSNVNTGYESRPKRPGEL